MESLKQICADCGAQAPAGWRMCPNCLFRLALAGSPDDEAASGPAVSGGGNSCLSLEESVGAHIGKYKLLEVIGEGAFGTVWMAEQQQTVRRRVALKILKFGMDTREVVARFEAERQALAMMDHPNIARVFDGGATESGRPFFVMELVRGLPIIQFCDEKRLTTSERLQLFAHVCEAVQHAHQKGVIHRDLKPTNILVTEQDGQAVPKVIDFGVAKAIAEPLTENTLFTRFHQFLGTPAYMSPEQAGMGGLDIDTRSDIYSLGVLLYELVSGKPPIDQSILDGRDPEALFRAIRDSEPPKPSTRLTSSSREELNVALERRRETLDQLHRHLKGELDWIILKAMDKDRSRRYQTASALAADLRNHLRGGAVTAAPPTLSYRFSKFARQNRAALITAAVFVLVLVAGASATAWQAVRATSLARSEAIQRKRAELNEAASLKTLYAAEMNVAVQARRDNNLGRAAELLEKHTPKNLAAQPPASLWEWRWLWSNARSDEFFRFGNHTDVVTSAAFTPDAKFVVTGCSDHVTRIWDFNSRQLTASFKSPDGVRSVACSHNNKWIVAAGHAPLVLIWDRVEQRPLHQITVQGAVLSVAVSRDDKWVAAASHRSLAVINPETGTIVKSIPIRHGWWLPSGLAFSPDLSALAYDTGRGGGAMLDLTTGNSIDLPSPHVGEILSMAFTPDGKSLVTGSYDGVIKIRHGKTGAVENTWKNEAGTVVSLAVSPDGRLLAAAGSDQKIRLYDSKTWRQVNQFQGHLHEIWSLTFSNDGMYILSSGSTDQTARIWKTDQPPASPPLVAAPEGLSAVAPSIDGALIMLCYTNGTWNLFDCDSSKFTDPVPFPPGQVATAAAVSVDRQIAIADAAGSVWLLDSRNPTTSRTLRGPGSPIPALFFNQDTTKLAIIRRAGLDICDLTGKPVLEIAASAEQPPKAQISAFSFFPVGNKVALGYGVGLIEIYDLKTRACIGSFNQHRWMVVDLTISPDGKSLVSSGAEGHIKKMDLETKQIIEIPMTHLSAVNSVGFSPDGTRLAAGGDRGQVVVWDIQSEPPLELVQLRDGTRDNLLSQFSRDGRFLIGIGNFTGGFPDILIWRAPTWEQVAARLNSRNDHRDPSNRHD